MLTLRLFHVSPKTKLKSNKQTLLKLCNREQSFEKNIKERKKKYIINQFKARRNSGSKLDLNRHSYDKHK